MPELETPPDPVDTLCALAPLVSADRRSLAAALHGLRQFAADDAAPATLRRRVQKNTISLRHALSVRHRALWLSRAGRQPEALLALDVAKGVLRCESSPCPLRQIDAWLPLHTRAMELLDETRRGIFQEWRRGVAPRRAEAAAR
jgi:hypothetical protein